MCFSASASFTAGAVLSVIGVVTIRKAQAPSQRPFAAIPLIFAIQQISEGFLWMALSNRGFEHLQQFTMYTFLFFAQVVWPFWVPFATLKFEERSERRKILIVLTAIGTIVSVYLGYCLVMYNVSATIEGLHISYLQDYPIQLGLTSAVFYLAATLAPAFFSSARYMWLLGAVIFVSYLITTIFYNDYVVSVWCFFASVISIGVFAVVIGQRKTGEQSPTTTI